MTASAKPHILLVEDDQAGRETLAEWIERQGWEPIAVRDGDEALQHMHDGVAVIVTDLKMPRTDGMELLRRATQQAPHASVIMISGHGTIETAVEALKEGAFDFLTKPVNLQELYHRITRALERRTMAADIAELHRQLRERHGVDDMVGQSTAMRQLFEKIRLVADTNSTVLIIGESGTGKELVARTLHELSSRKPRPFVAVNCAAIPESLIESEIFGHEKGAFTGALERRTGCFELAEGGTLLLDEIGEMPVATQAKLLRVLEDRKLRRLGSKTETSIDVRVLAATNKVPEEAVASGQLRNDLYYRLNVFNIHMPPLRDHKDDLPALVQFLLQDMNSKHNRSVSGVTDDVSKAFQNYAWPGNVRELRNTLERAVILCESRIVEPKHLPPGFGSVIPRAPVQEANGIRLGVGTTVEEAEKLLILKTLESTNNNKTRAAEILGISLKTLHNKLKEYGQSSAATTAAEAANS